MQRRSLLLFAAIVMAVLCVSSLNLVAEEADKSADVVSIAKKTAGMKRMDGLFPLDWDARAGKLYLEIGSFNKDFLMLDSLPYGVGRARWVWIADSLDEGEWSAFIAADRRCC